MEALDNWTLENWNFTLNYDKKTFILCYHKGKKLIGKQQNFYTCRCLKKNLALADLIYIYI